MSLFEFEDGQLIPAQFGRPISGGISPAILDAVRSQVLDLLARPLFPITWRDLARVADGSTEPRLTALDSAGQVVSVEITGRLDSQSLIASLSRLADTAALSWTDLAAEYPGGIDAFKAGWLRFSDTMPPTAAAGPRLIILAGQIDSKVRPAIDVLAASGVEVHEMHLRQMSNGRAFLDVQAVGPRFYGHAPAVLMGRTSPVPALTSLRRQAADDTVGGSATTIPAPAAPTASIGEGGAGEPDAAESDTAAEVSAALDPMPAAMPEPEPAAEAEADPVPEMRRPVFPRRSTLHQSVPGEPVDDEAPEVEAAAPERTEKPESDGSLPWKPVFESDPVVESAPASAAPAPFAPFGAVPAPVAEPARTDESRASAPAASHPFPSRVDRTARDVAAADEAATASSSDAREPVQAPPGVELVGHDAHGLRIIAQVLGEDVPLYVRPTLEPVPETWLMSDGVINSDGIAFDDPTQVLAAAGRFDLDGWDEWHVGDVRGPSLAESVEEVNVEIVREHERTAEAQRSVEGPLEGFQPGHHAR